ncbi:hypothetical protein NQP46_03450 [Streptomyces albus]|nr:hypothetical protein NQP46_03450 [Streptomyces albus]
MGDEEAGASVGEGAESLEDLVFGAGVEGCCGFAEGVDGGVGVEGAGEGEALPLAAGEVVSAPP